MNPDPTPVSREEIDLALRRSAPRTIACPSSETRTWKRVRLAENVFGYQTPEGVIYVNARADEEPEIILTFNWTGLPASLGLVRSDMSVTVTRVGKGARRQARELRKRGLIK